jgi:hypothetical protein
MVGVVFIGGLSSNLLSMPSFAQTFGEKHAQQVLQDRGQGSEQAACHASAQPRVCLLPWDVILSAATDLREGHRDASLRSA